MMLDADPLGFGPQQIRYGRDITTARRSYQPADSLRLYVVEPAYTLTGALADHRVSLRPELVRNVAIEIARNLGAPLAAAELPADIGHFARVAADDLAARRGAAFAH